MLPYLYDLQLDPKLIEVLAKMHVITVCGRIDIPTGSKYI